MSEIVAHRGEGESRSFRIRFGNASEPEEEYYSRDELDIDISYGLAVSQMIMVIASAQTDVTLIQKECSDLGVDWQDMMLYRTQNAMLEWKTLELLESI